MAPKLSKFCHSFRSVQDMLALAQAAIYQAATYAQENAVDVCNPVIDVGTAVKAGLDKFDDAAVGACADEDG